MKHYAAVLNGEEPPDYLLLRTVGVNFEGDEELPALIKKHDRAMRLFRQMRIENAAPHKKCGAGSNLLDLKSHLARRLLEECVFCRRRCEIDRTAGDVGFCGVGSEGVVASEFLHLGEEPELVPSHTIFFRGCTMRCAYCQNWDLLPADGRGASASTTALAELVRTRAEQGAINVNWVGGDPTPNLHTVLGTLTHMEVPLPQVLNSNMYYSGETMELLEGAVDVYLADMRYGNDDCASRLSSAPGYRETVTRNFLHANRTADVLVRHLVLPGHLECCTRPVVEWCAEHLGPQVRFNLMFQYHPEYRAGEHPEINRRLTHDERVHALELCEDAGLCNLVD